MAGEAEAAAVLARLVGAGVAIVDFGPAVGDLEHTFLDLARGAADPAAAPAPAATEGGER
ncbi:MAG: hypothetical protein ACO1N6_01830 [Microcella sp.]